MDTNNIPTKKNTVYLPIDIDERLRKSARKNRRSYNGELVWALQQYLDQQERGCQPPCGTIYDNLKSPFQGARYQDMPEEDCPKVMHWFQVQLERVKRK